MDVKRESDYYREQSRGLTTLVQGIGWGVAGLMGLGAIIGAVLTMYSAVVARTREIATLRALGFGSLPVMLSILGESMVLALAGGVIGGALAYAGFNGFQTSTMNWQTFSQVAFGFAVTPSSADAGPDLRAHHGLPWRHHSGDSRREIADFESIARTLETIGSLVPVAVARCLATRQAGRPLPLMCAPRAPAARRERVPHGSA